MRITIDEELKDNNLQELLDVLSGKQTPFNLPAAFAWPSSVRQRTQTERAIRLMLAGLESLKQQYPKTELTDIIQKKDQTKENLTSQGW